MDNDDLLVNYVYETNKEVNKNRDADQEVLYPTIPTKLPYEYLYLFDDLEDFI